jgi:magnesium transporter
MAVLPAETHPPMKDQAGAALKVRVVYRDSSGKIQFSWPTERIREAVDDNGGIVWIDIENPAALANGTADEILRGVFHFHPLAIEDALKEVHNPKVDDWGDYLLIVFHSIDFAPDSQHLRLHELDVFLGRNYLVTYHVEPLNFLEQDRRNIERDPTNRMRHGADHLLYHLLDMAVADYLPVIEHLDLAIDQAQEEVFKNPTPRTLRAIFRVKRTTLRLHRILGPEREVLNRLARDSYEPIAEGRRVYFRDVYDHLVRIHDLTESLRDLISGALDTYLSAISNRTNDIMKMLTLVTVMFLPVSFLTGFFGMNFFADNLSLRFPMPKLALFILSCLFIIGSVWAQWHWARRRGWF